MENPIKDNRVVNDITFAIRFKHFIKNIAVNDWASEEEQSYLLDVANSLLEYQKETCTDKEEINYFNNLNIIIKNND